jgi:RNA recognition motif-containing protein
MNNSNSIINGILAKMSQIDIYFENAIAKKESANNMTDSTSSLIDADFLTKTFIKQEPESFKYNNQSNKQQSSGDKRKLFVGNLPAKTTLQELFNAFKVYGPINEQLCVVKDENYAFIHFHEEKDAEKAYIAMNDSFFKNRYIRVQYSTSQGHVKKTKSKFVYNILIILYN